MRRLFLVLAAVIALAAPADAALDLGLIDENKVRSFAEYFKPYIGQRDTEYPNEELKNKVLTEARDIHAWLENEANWPPAGRITPGLLTSAGLLYSYFTNLDFEGAREKASRYLSQAAEKDPKNVEIQLANAQFFSQADDPLAYQAGVAAEKALQLDEATATAAHAHYLAATSFYKAGYFRKAREYLQKQAELDPEYENTRDLSFVFESLVEKWKRVPEHITFEPNEAGDLVPVPDDEVG